MIRCFCVCVLLAGCGDSLSGEAGFAVGRTTIVPCADASGDPGALLIVESLQECWISAPGERRDCDTWVAAVQETPEICTDQIVFDSPSNSTLTGFFGPPIDPGNVIGAGTAQVFELACNPQGPGAADYPNFQDFLQVFSGDVSVTADDNGRGRVEFDMYVADPDTLEPNRERPALQGQTRAQVCR
ncbi:MAG: hypothetical protein AB8H79_01530 [Myxococcota bacterium]